MKSPWYPRYPQDIISSIDCRTMTLEAFGLYNWLLDYSWTNPEKPCHLKLEIDRLAKIIGTSRRKFEAIWPLVAKKFALWINPETGDKWIYNERLLAEYQIRMAQADKQSDRARLAAKKRWKKDATSNATSMPQAMLVASAKHCLSNSPLQSQSQVILPSEELPIRSVVQNTFSKKKKSVDKHTYGQFSNVLLSEAEFGKLCVQFGEAGSQERIENLSSYIASKGTKYRSHYATILVWEGKDAKENHVKQRTYESFEQAKVRRNDEAARKALEFMHGDSGESPGNGNNRGTDGSLSEATKRFIRESD